jgi:hypothetical protein
MRRLSGVRSWPSLPADAERFNVNDAEDLRLAESWL